MISEIEYDITRDLKKLFWAKSATFEKKMKCSFLGKKF